jgi:hypothetical protein
MKAQKMMTINRHGTIKISDAESENRRLRELLQKAVNKEKAPESLREKLRKMIRE